MTGDCEKTSLVKSGIIRYKIGYLVMKEPSCSLGQDLVKLIAEIDGFKGRWDALKTLSPDRLKKLRKIATVECIGSSTRIEGAKLTDAQVGTLLSNIEMQSFNTRDEL